MTNKQNKKAQSIGTEPSSPNGGVPSTPQYGTSGNDQYAGGSSFFPWKTRNKKLLELLNKIKKKLNS